MYYILIAYAIKLKAELRERERERERKKHPTFMRWTSSTTQYLFYLQKNGSSSHTSFWLFCSFFNTFFYTYIRIVLAALFRAHFFRARIQCVSCIRTTVHVHGRTKSIFLFVFCLTCLHLKFSFIYFFYGSIHDHHQHLIDFVAFFLCFKIN